MNIQNQIKRTLSDTQSIRYLASVLNDQTISSRTELARHACKKFGFYDPRGNMQTSGCLKALRSLEAAGHFVLPVSQKTSGKKSPRRLDHAVPQPIDVPSTAGNVRGLKLIQVVSPDDMRIWNELMITEHPLKDGPLVGRQLRYLIHSDHGWLGGFGFAAPALQLADRDHWIGWDAEQRQTHLQFVVGMSRFLIRPSIQCKNLASKVLGMAMASIADDFEHNYHYRPLLLESFADIEKYEGTCYQATNWMAIGKTKGRGRQDQLNQSALSIKAIYVYPLEKTFRQQMGLSDNAGLGALQPADGLDARQWAEHEFGDAPVGDARTGKRLVACAATKAEAPGRAFSGTVNGNKAATKGYYRMIDLPEDSAFNLDNILAPHRQRTARRMMGQKTVLCLQDGSELNYTRLDKCSGLGTLKANQTGAKTKGLVLHSTFAVAPNGLPLGVLKAQCMAPVTKDPDDKRKPPAIPIEEKKTFVWIEHYRDLVELGRQIPQTRLVSVCDREADFFEMFDEQRLNPGADVLIRAKHNRKLGGNTRKLFERVRETEEQSRVRVFIPRKSARAKKSKQKKCEARPARRATLALRKQRIQLLPPEGQSDKAPIDIWIVHALETNPPKNVNTVEWFLLTTVNILSGAEECLRWYTLRWRIEDWHRVLKSGCRIHKLAHETAGRLRRAIGINLVIGWRIMLMTLLGREMPELPAKVLYSNVELSVLRAYAKKKAKTPCIVR